MDTKIVAETPDIGLATFLHELLESAGIRAELASQGGASVLPGIAAGSYAIVVSAADAETAHALIAEAETTDASAAAVAGEEMSERPSDDQIGGGVAGEA